MKKGTVAFVSFLIIAISAIVVAFFLLENGIGDSFSNSTLTLVAMVSIAGAVLLLVTTPLQLSLFSDQDSDVLLYARKRVGAICTVCMGGLMLLGFLGTRNTTGWDMLGYVVFLMLGSYGLFCTAIHQLSLLIVRRILQREQTKQ